MKTVVAILTGIILIGISGTSKLQAQSKSSVRVYLEHFRNQEKRELSVRVLTKPEKRYLPAAGVEVKVYIYEINDANLLGTITTAHDGTGTYTLNQQQSAQVAAKNAVQYFAVVNETESLSRKETEIIINDVQLDVVYFGDTIWQKQIYVHVFETDSAGNKIPQEDVAIKFLVDRPLSPLPVSDVFNPEDDESITSTDLNGNISLNFPDDLPGDEDGNIQILIRIIEHDDYGTVEVSAKKPWGIPSDLNDLTLKRSLWASGANAPISLLIFVNSLIIAVWGMIFYIIYKIFRIRKIGQAES